jgi:hypothetical protein
MAHLSQSNVPFFGLKSTFFISSILSISLSSTVVIFSMAGSTTSGLMSLGSTPFLFDLQIQRTGILPESPDSGKP